MPAQAATENKEPPRRKRVVVVMFDTLCRHFLPPYGNEWVKAPNFERLARKTAQFDNFYVGSQPCMPARREMHTGRYNFLHRAWGPLEPFDDSMPSLLHRHGVHSHKVTDHHHYWEDGGATYHQRFSTFDLIRGQEGDKWIGDVDKLRDPAVGTGIWPETATLEKMKQDIINREHMTSSELMPQAITFSRGLDFIHRNQNAKGDWYLQIETFDPHEPFFSQKEFQELYPHEYEGPPFDWPPYREVREDKQTVEHIRYMYASLVTFCDQQLGRVLDVFDEYNMWDDTMLIVNTDHGFLMGEHDWWAKTVTPFFQEIAHIPFWVYDPRHPSITGVRRSALAQTIDLAPTVLDYFGVKIPESVQGSPLESRLVSDDLSVRAAAIYGVFGGQVNVTDGRYVYMRGPKDRNAPLFEYTLMPTRMHHMFRPSELRNWTRHDGFTFTKGTKLMKVPSKTPSFLEKKEYPMGRARICTLLFDVVADPGQVNPLDDADIEAKMIALLLREMAMNDCPSEQYERLGLPAPTCVVDEKGLVASCELPSEELIRAACVVHTDKGREHAAWKGNGFPKMPFYRANSRVKPRPFPESLRLRPGYAFAQTQTPPKKPQGRL